LLLAGFSYASEAKQKAKEHFQNAEARYKLGRFEEALQEYSKAYEFAPLPAFLFNMGQCHRQLNNHERAVFFYEGYLRDKPDAKNREIVERLIKESKQELERQEAERKRQEQLKAEKEQQKAEEERRKAEKERLRLERERKLRLEKEHKLALERARLEAQALAESQKPVEKPPAFYQKWWFWTIVGGAVAVIAGGTALALSSEDNMILPGGSLGTLDLREP
jgi:tetratricopeptide (TPR) repeat protein